MVPSPVSADSTPSPAHRRGGPVAALLLGAWLSGMPAAQAVTLDAIDSGFITSAGGSDKFDALAAPGAKYNYSVGWELHYPGGGLMPSTPLIEMDRKNYFVFDLSGVTSPILSASIELVVPAGG